MTERRAPDRWRWVSAPALGAGVLAGILVAACAGASTTTPTAVGGGPTIGASSRPTAGPSNATASPMTRTPSSSAAGAPSADAPIAPTAFHSERYGYRLAVPAGWKVTENPGTGGVHPGDPGVDVFTDGRGNTLYVIAEPIPAGTSSDAWTSGVARHLEVDHGLTPDGSANVMVGGLQGRLIDYHLRFDPYVTHELVTQVVRNDRGYAITLEALGGRDADDQTLLETLLAGFAFDG